MRSSLRRGCAFVCTREGRIRRVLMNHLDARLKKAGTTIPDLVAPDCQERVRQFLDRLQTHSVAFCSGVRFFVGRQSVVLDCSGAVLGQDFLIIAAPDPQSIGRLSERLLNKQSSVVESLETEHAREVSTRLRRNSGGVAARRRRSMAVAMKRWRILIADDHEAFLDQVQGQLESRPDFEVAGRVRSGAEALEACRQLAPDFLVMDLSMPHMHGIEAARRVKSLPKPPRVVILTLHAGEDYELAAREAGADALLCKTDLESLVPALCRLLDRASSSEASSESLL